MKTKQNRPTTWYIDSMSDPATNATVAGLLPEENCCTQTLCADGEKRDLWQCPHKVVTSLENAKSSLGLRFRVFVRQGNFGQARLWRFGKRGSRRAVMA